MLKYKGCESWRPRTVGWVRLWVHESDLGCGGECARGFEEEPLARRLDRDVVAVVNREAAVADEVQLRVQLRKGLLVEFAWRRWRESRRLSAPHPIAWASGALGSSWISTYGCERSRCPFASTAP